MERTTEEQIKSLKEYYKLWENVRIQDNLLKEIAVLEKKLEKERL